MSVNSTLASLFTVFPITNNFIHASIMLLTNSEVDCPPHALYSALGIRIFLNSEKIVTKIS